MISCNHELSFTTYNHNIYGQITKTNRIFKFIRNKEIHIKCVKYFHL